MKLLGRATVEKAQIEAANKAMWIAAKPRH
jgi:hypothetical protein